MTKYRIIQKVILHDSLDYDQAKDTMSIMNEQVKDIDLHIEEYQEIRKARLGRNPDLH